MLEIESIFKINSQNRDNKMDSKTLSTNHSNPNLNVIPVHSYHKYETILNYFTSFIADVRLNVVDLKQIIYDVTGLEIKATLKECYHSECQCDSCEV